MRRVKSTPKDSFSSPDLTAGRQVAEEIALSKFQTLTKLLERKAGTWITDKAQAIRFKK